MRRLRTAASMTVSILACAYEAFRTVTKDPGFTEVHMRIESLESRPQRAWTRGQLEFVRGYRRKRLEMLRARLSDLADKLRAHMPDETVQESQ